jgi:hypothetical protein
MKVGVVLVSSDGFYATAEGKLPARPSWDKAFITALAKGSKVLVSPNTLAALPPSIVKVASRIDTPSFYPDDSWDVNFGIATFRAYPPKLMFICKSAEPLHAGKPFDFAWLRAEYATLYVSEDIEICCKK